MQADQIRLLFDYSYAATGRILDAASRLTTEEFTAPPPLHGAVSLRHTLVHTLWAEQAWREGLRPAEPTKWRSSPLRRSRTLLR